MNHTEEMIPNLNGACYAVRSMVHISNINIVKSTYYAYFHSITKYGIIFWGNSFNRGKIFTSKKKLVKRMAGAQPRPSRRSLVNIYTFYLNDKHQPMPFTFNNILV